MDDNAADEQATHSPHIARMIYARDVLELVGSSTDKRQRFRQVSTDWHRFLAFESVEVKSQPEPEQSVKRKWEESDEAIEEERVRRRRRIQQMDASVELQRIMRKEVAFRSV